MLPDTPASIRHLLLIVIACGLGGCGSLPWKKGDQDSDAAPSPPMVSATVTGVDDDVAQNVRAHVGLLSERCDSASRLLAQLTTEAVDEARQALRAYGYYEAAVQTTLQRNTGDCPVLQIAVAPGPRVQLTEVDISLDGAAGDDTAFQGFLGTLPLRKDQPLNHRTYRATKSRIESYAADHGYFDGRFSRHELRVQPSRQRARATLVFASGAQYVFGDLRLTQAPYAIDDEVIRRFLEFRSGEPYSGARIAAMNEALRGSDYFESVDIRPQLGSRQAGSVPLDIALVPRKRYSFSVGAGFSTDESVRTRFQFLDRHFNDRGHRVVVSARASGIAQQFSGEYRVPLAHPRSEWLSLQTGVRRETVNTFDTLEAQTTLSETRERPFGWLETRFIEANKQRFKIGRQTQTAFVLPPGLRYTKTSLDDDIYPSRGYRLRAEIKGASDTLASDTDVVRTLVSGAYIDTLPWRDRVLLRAGLGALWVGDFSLLTPSLRYFAGGDASIRGYGYQDLGPVDSKGKVIGGRYLGTASVEYEYVLTDRWSIAGFTDAGNAFGGDGRDTGIKTSVGVGLRWRSPIGPVKVDLAHPLDDATQVRLHLRVGPDL